MKDNFDMFIKTAHKLKTTGLVSDGVNKGSLSLRVDNNNILMTPSKISYDDLNECNINIMDLSGNIVKKNAPISRDFYFHLEIYRKRPDVNAIIHTHSKYATALCLANKKIPFILYGMKFHCGGDVDIAPFEFPNSKECNIGIIDGLKDKKAVLLQNHGLICVGENLSNCYETAEFVEALSESYIHALSIDSIYEIEKWKEVNYG